MPSFKNLREYLLEADIRESTRESVETHDVSLRTAIRLAAKKLEVHEHQIEYEIVQKGDSGIFGLGSIPFIIRAHVMGKEARSSDLEEKDVAFSAEERHIERQPFYIRLDKRRIYLKIFPSQDEHRISESEIFNALAIRTTVSVSKEKVSRILRKASGKDEELCSYENDITQDAQITCTVYPDNLSVSISAIAAGINGADVGVKDIEAVLKQRGILYGIQPKRIQDFVEMPVYDTSSIVVQGDAPEKGADAWIEYKFETSPVKFMLSSKEDRIDYRELNKLQNVKEGEVVAIKHPAEEGKDGTSVFGELLLAEKGKDAFLSVGDNVELSLDGMTAIAKKDGLAQIKKGKIVVEPIFYVSGDVDIKTGNIRFIGSVYIQGSVTDGFTVEAEGDIKIVGSVGKARVVSQGNIFVYRGIAGKEEAYIEAKESMWSRFVEHCTVKVGGMLIVSDGIINSHVMAFGSVICRGKRASIVGGSIRASYYVDTKNLGALSGVKTIVEVGTDPDLLMRKEQLEHQLDEQVQLLRDMPLNIATMHRKLKMLDIQSSESAEKEKARLKEILEKMQAEHAEINAKRTTLEEELRNLQMLLATSKAEAMISVQRKLHIGVQVRVGQANLDIRKEHHMLSLYNAEGIVQFKKYKQPKMTLPNPL